MPLKPATSLMYRHHTFKKSNGKDVELKEVGPRFEMKCKSTTPSCA